METLVFQTVCGCCELEELPSMETLVSLEKLLAEECVKLKSIMVKELGQVIKLRSSIVCGSFELEVLQVWILNYLWVVL